jgi:transcriptional regulator with XRE-family HTH domain
MTENVQGLRGDYRKLTPVEVGIIIRAHREERGIKRAALAIDADVSEKTIERAESGAAIKEDSGRRIAKALGMAPHAFTRELFIPSPEEAVRYQEQQDEERKRTHSPVAVTELRGVKDVLSLFGSCAYLADEDCVEEKHLRDFAALKQNFTDWADIVGHIPEPERVSAAEGILAQVREFEALGYVVKGGVIMRYLTGVPGGAPASKFPFTLMLAFKKPKGAKDTTPAEVWLPKKMPMNF